MTHEEVSKELINIKAVVKKHENNINKENYRELILEVVKERGAVGITALKQALIEAKIDIVPFNKAILKIIGELTGLGEN
jgi:hypothetical protein